MKEKILIVDDDPGILDLLTVYLGHKYDVIRANSAFHAVEILKGLLPSLIISDLIMPKMDGIELFKSIRDNDDFPFIPFIILTSIKTEAIEEFSFSFGVDEYLKKPIDKDSLLKIVDKILVSTEAFRVTNKNKIVLSGLIKRRFDEKLISNLYQIIQTQRTGIFEIVQNQVNEGYIWIRKGQFLHAEFGYSKGIRTIKRILNMESGRYVFQEKNFRNIENSINENSMNLIMNICKDRDEKRLK